MAPVTPERMLKLFARKHWPSIAHHIHWETAPPRGGLVSRRVFEARRRGTEVHITFYGQPNFDDLSGFRTDAHEACRAANDLIRGYTSAGKVGD